MTIIHGIVSDRKNVRGGSTASKRRESDNTILYIAALCVVDFLMAISLPPMILVLIRVQSRVDSILGFYHWLLDIRDNSLQASSCVWICRENYEHFFDNSHVFWYAFFFLKWILFSDRFVAVCHPYKIHLRSRKFIVSTIFSESNN